MTCLSQIPPRWKLTLNLLECLYFLLTTKRAYTHCKKETNNVCGGNSNSRFIYLYVFCRVIFYTFVSQLMNPGKSRVMTAAADCSFRGFVGALGHFPSVN